MVAGAPVRSASINRAWIAACRRHWPALGVGGRTCRVLRRPCAARALTCSGCASKDISWRASSSPPRPLESFCQENGVPARRRTLARFDVYEARACACRGDFFALTPELLGDIAAVYDRAALISWAPALRDGYIAQLAKLLRAGTRMLLITLEYRESQMTGPPFAVPAEEVTRLYAPQFEVSEIAREDILPHEARLRAKGLTELVEVCYQVVRL